MAFIRVKNSRVDSKGPEHAHTTDTEHNLLSNPVLFVSAIEPRRQFAIAVLVFFDIGVHKIKRHGAKIYPPHDDKDVQASDLQLDEEPVVILGACGFDRRFTAF